MVYNIGTDVVFANILALRCVQPELHFNFGIEMVLSSLYSGNRSIKLTVGNRIKITSVALFSLFKRSRKIQDETNLYDKLTKI